MTDEHILAVVKDCAAKLLARNVALEAAKPAYRELNENPLVIVYNLANEEYYAAEAALEQAIGKMEGPHD